MQSCRCACLIALLAVAAHAENGWEYARLGKPQDATVATTGGILFAGGGTDVDEAFRWMCAKANGGDFLILRASGTAAYNTYVRDLCPALNSVATLIVTSRNGAQQPFVADTIRKAEAIFIAGGDQANYINFYSGTPVAEALSERAAHGVPIGGTSAGNAVLAQFGYSALTGSVTSKQALADPYTPLITISNGFLNLSPLLRGFFTDDHFAARDRMGRLVVFLARIIQDGLAPSASAIATDERTAYLMEPDGSGRVVGSGAAYFIRTTELPEVCKPGKPLTFKNLYIYRVRVGEMFNISKWAGTSRAAYGISAINGVLMPVDPSGSIY